MVTLRSYKRTDRYASPDWIDEAEVFSRVLTAIRTLRAMPDQERRFLASGTKAAWPETLVEFSDLVARADGPVESDSIPVRHDPKRTEISDALVAGEWFARLALLHENYADFERRILEFRAGSRPTPQVDDQRFLTWYAQGWSLKNIGQRLGLNEHEAERRLYEIARSLWRIANGAARLVDPETSIRGRKLAEARDSLRRAQS